MNTELAIRRLIGSEAGDVLIHKRQQYRMVAVQRFGDWRGPWFDSVRECVQSRGQPPLPAVV